MPASSTFLELALLILMLMWHFESAVQIHCRGCHMAHCSHAHYVTFIFLFSIFLSHSSDVITIMIPHILIDLPFSSVEAGRQMQIALCGDGRGSLCHICLIDSSFFTLIPSHLNRTAFQYHNRLLIPSWSWPRMQFIELTVGTSFEGKRHWLIAGVNLKRAARNCSLKSAKYTFQIPVN